MTTPEDRTRLEKGLRAFLQASDGEAWNEEQVGAYVDGQLPAEDRAAFELSLAEDPQLRLEVADLQALRKEMRLGRPERRGLGGMRAALAAAAALALAVFGWRALSPAPDTVHVASSTAQPSPPEAAPRVTLEDGAGQVLLAHDGTLRGLPKLAPEFEAAVAGALREGQLSLPAELGHLRGRAGVLMGAGGAESRFAPEAPVGTQVSDLRPRFNWNPHPQARAYVVTVLDAQLDPVAESPELRGTSWTPDRPLRHGREYIWQVAALTPGGRVTTPAPPLPEARFRVLSEREAAVLKERLAAGNGSHLAATVAYAEAGLVAEARKELAALRAQNPESVALRQLETRLLPPR